MRLSNSPPKQLILIIKVSDQLNQLIKSELKEENYGKEFVTKFFHTHRFFQHKELPLSSNWMKSVRPFPADLQKRTAKRPTHKFIQTTEKVKNKPMKNSTGGVLITRQFWEDTIKLLGIKFQKPFSKKLTPLKVLKHLGGPQMQSLISLRVASREKTKIPQLFFKKKR